MNKVIAIKKIMAFKELLFVQMHTLVFNIIKKDNSIDIQNEGSAEIYCMEMNYEPTGTLNESFLNLKSSKEIVILKSVLRTGFCKSIINQAKENYYITDNDLVRLIEYFEVSVVIVKDYKNLNKQFIASKYFISDCNFNVTKKKYIIIGKSKC